MAAVRRTLGLTWSGEGLADAWGAGAVGRDDHRGDRHDSHDRGERAGLTVNESSREVGGQDGEEAGVGPERERGLGFVAPGEEKHRELCEVARRLFGAEWT